HLIYIAAGLALYIGLVRLMQYLGVRRAVAVPAATLFVVSPSFVLYEHFLLYSFPIALLLVLTAVALGRFVESPSRLRALVFCTCVIIACGTHATFQLPYYLLIVGGVWALYPPARQTLPSAAVAPFGLLCAWLVKNAIVFGALLSSSWLGMQLAFNTVT